MKELDYCLQAKYCNDLGLKIYPIYVSLGYVKIALWHNGVETIGNELYSQQTKTKSDTWGKKINEMYKQYYDYFKNST